MQRKRSLACIYPLVKKKAIIFSNSPNFILKSDFKLFGTINFSCMTRPHHTIAHDKSGSISLGAGTASCRTEPELLRDGATIIIHQTLDSEAVAPSLNVAPFLGRILNESLFCQIDARGRARSERIRQNGRSFTYWNELQVWSDMKNYPSHCSPESN